LRVSARVPAVAAAHPHGLGPDPPPASVRAGPGLITHTNTHHASYYTHYHKTITLVLAILKLCCYLRTNYCLVKR